ncbi:alanine glycine permease [Oscillatoriales cyanobacterium USR001]|nr:alanine glycine permease [Oscillatoriales cyanobacterium USR001]
MLSQNTELLPNILDIIDTVFQEIVDRLSIVIFFKIGGENGFPLIVLWLICAAIFFTIRLGFPNIRLFKHAIDVVMGKYDDPNDSGQVSHFQALATALSGTIGLGNIAGVAIAIQLGGPGASFWMTLAGFVGMTSKFMECGLATKYRIIEADGTVEGGPMYYIKKGFADRGMSKIGQFLSYTFTFLLIPATLGTSVFQSNQAAAAFIEIIPGLPNWLFGIIIATIVGFVLIGGITRIVTITDKLTPSMAILYIIACGTILIHNFNLIPGAIATIITSAFAPQAVAGGIIGSMVMGIRRSCFSNEAGIGTAAIAHAAVKTNEPLREGIVALLEPFIDTIIVCNLTAITIVSTGVYATSPSGTSGIGITTEAFKTITDWFPIILLICVLLFAISTLISWSYYGQQAWIYLFGKPTLILYHLIYIFFAFLGTIVSVRSVVDFSDMMSLSMAVPNLIACYLLSNEVSADLKDYLHRLNSGLMPIKRNRN